MSADQVLLVLSNAPDRIKADHIARHLVEHRLAACVNVLAPCHSVYTWEGTIHEEQEIPLLIKTTAVCYPMLQEAMHELHPHAVPELLAFPATGGLPQYLAWVLSNCGTPSHDV
ncbi:MAG: divalent-cation tolerance protein CutA [Rhodocyclaceae bacterium]